MAKARSYKRIVIVILLLVIAAAAWWYFQTDDRASPVFTTTTVSEGDISQVVTATGSLEPVTSIEVGSQVSGLITEVLVDFNSLVKKGQLIAKIDPATYDQRLRQAEADLASSQANHTLVRLNTERTRDLRAKNLVSQQELDQAEATLSQANAGLLTKQAVVDNAKVDLSRCSIYAPVDGIVLDRKTDVGRTVAASLNAPVLFVIADDLANMQINAAIAEADIGAVKDGQLVNFNVDAFPNREFRGRVLQIRNSPIVQSNVVTYQTIIAVRNDEKNLKPGMTANVSVVVASRHNVIRIANSTLRVRMPVSLLPVEPTAENPVKSGEQGKTAELSPEARRAQMSKLMQDAGYDRNAGPPTPEIRAKIQALAKERGIELPDRGNGHAGAGPVETTRTVYKLGGTTEAPKVIPIIVKLGITDGINTEVLDGLKSGDVLITSALIPGGDGKAEATTNPFSSARRRR